MAGVICTLPFKASCASPTASDTHVFPTQIITVSQELIRADTVVDVTFRQNNTDAPSDNASYAVTVKGIAHQDGEVMVAVPPFIDLSTGNFATGTVYIIVKGQQSEQNLLVENFLELAAETNGQILRTFLEFSLQHYGQTLDNLAAIAAEAGADTAPSVSAIQGQLAQLTQWLSEIEETGTLTIETPTGMATLSPSALTQIDAWLLHILIITNVMLNSGDVPATASAFDGRGDANLRVEQKPVLDIIRESWEAFQQQNIAGNPDFDRVKENVTSLVEDTQEAIKDAVTTKIPVFLGAVSAFVTGIGWVANESLAIAANALGLALAQASAVVGSVQAWWTQQNTDAFLARRQEEFDTFAEGLSQTVRLGAEYCANYANILGAMAFEKLCTAISAGVTIKDALVAAHAEICQRMPDHLLCTGFPTTFWLLSAIRTLGPPAPEPGIGRFEGSLKEWTVSEGRMSYRTRFVDQKSVFSDWTFAFTSTAPKTLLEPGTTITLKATGSRSENEPHLGGGAFAVFSYLRDSGRNGQGSDGLNTAALGTASVSHSVASDEITVTLTVPNGIDKTSELSLIADLGPCPSPPRCRVMWIYKWRVGSNGFD